MTTANRRIVLVHREEPTLNVYDMPEDDVFEALDTEGRFLLKLPLSNTMVGPWVVVGREDVCGYWGEPYTRVLITRPS